MKNLLNLQELGPILFLLFDVDNLFQPLALLLGEYPAHRLDPALLLQLQPLRR